MSNISKCIIIDCDVDPFVPKGFQVEVHMRCGQLPWDPDAVRLYLSDSQLDCGWIGGHELRKQLTQKIVLNANVLDFLLDHTHLIPEAWKDKAIFFWGTVYRRSGDDLCVRYLRWHGGVWHWLYRWLDDDWRNNYASAMLADEDAA
jgi:hypothetical protein